MGACDFKRKKVVVFNPKKSTMSLPLQESIQYFNSKLNLSNTSDSIINNINEKKNENDFNLKKNKKKKNLNEKRQIYKNPNIKEDYIFNENDLSNYKCRNNDACNYFFQFFENKENTKFKEHIYTKCKYKKFYCIICKDIINKFEDISYHNCFTGKNKLNSLCYCHPFRNCINCGKTLIWNNNINNKNNKNYKIENNKYNKILNKIINDKQQNNKTKNKKEKYCFHLLKYHEKENYYYYCDNCNKLICETHAPPPISRVCGCGEKLKGGIIQKCSICKIEGGIGWYCNICFNGIEICENCLEEFNEIYFGPI